VTTQQTKNRRAGALWETTLLDYLRSTGHKAERLRLAGTNDEGDIALMGNDFNADVIIEAKAEKQINLASYVGEAEKEAGNYARRRGIDPADVDWCAVVKRRNHPVGKAYVVMTLDHYLGLDVK